MRPRLILYCQHSLGLGHFMRSLSLAEALAEHFTVTFFNGGPAPSGIDLPGGIEFVHLPPLRLQDDGSITGEEDAATLLMKRRDQMLAKVAQIDPAMLIIELYPFGRKKFAVEIDPLIDLVRAKDGQIVCSVRDVLVTARADQARHDERAAQTLNARFDRLLVHTDPALFRLEDSFRPATPLAVAIDYTGYVVRQNTHGKRGRTDGPTLVAAGGGVVGHALYHAAIEAQPLLSEAEGWAMTLVAGPLFPDADWGDLKARARGVSGLTLVRAVPSMMPLLAASGRFVGQCGYNSALEVCQSGLPALFVPFARGQESEQTSRAAKLQELGFAQWLPEAELDGPALAQQLRNLASPRTDQRIAMDGAQQTARLLKEAVRCNA